MWPESFGARGDSDRVTTYSAVRTTGIYCRPGCGAKPLAENVRTFELAAARDLPRLAAGAPATPPTQRSPGRGRRSGTALAVQPAVRLGRDAGLPRRAGGPRSRVGR
ncbi:Ada metal-binding domain-containing protein [Kribbella sp. NPDC050124]|uniref:Ada metal-binding domain-containing protein n=1 Tax=Kribbella sp. NPDC050124 TaxID=3364114 RepID=UPI0037B7C4FC